MQRPWIQAVVALSFGASTFAAHAVSASAEAGNILFTIEDLAPNDGVAPYVRFDSLFYRLDSVAGVDFTAPPVFRSRELDGRGSFCDSLSSESGGLQTFVGATVRGDALAYPTLRLEGSGTTSAEPRFFDLISRVGWSVTLGPQTRLGVSLDASVDTARRTTCYPGDRCDFAGSFVDLTVGIDLNPDDILLSSPEPGSAARRLVGFDANPSANGELSSQVHVFLRASGSQAAPIPEPETYLLTLIGLGVLAGRWRVTKRRR